MKSKNLLRKKYFNIRKNNYFDIESIFFKPLIKLIKKKSIKKKINLSLYYPTSYEVNILKIYNFEIINQLKLYLPVVSNSQMNFYKWKKNDILQINRFGILEPANFSKHIVPDIMLVPLLAYDSLKNRLGYGKGFYDSFLKKYLRKNNNILTIGIAFSFQKYHKLPVTNNDIKLNYILTEQGIF